MFFKTLIFVWIILGNNEQITEAVQTVNDDTYWRDLHGDIPIDALPGGSTESNSTTYIGQAVHARTLWFGDVQSDGFIYYNLHTELVSQRNHIKILCTKHPDRFRWQTIHDELDFRQINKDRLVSDDFDNSNCFVGRAHYHNSIVVGTVCFEHGKTLLFNGATTFKNFETKTFQVLVYNFEPHVNTSNVQNKCALLILLTIVLVCMTYN